MARGKAPGAAAGRGRINPYRAKEERPRPRFMRISAIFKGGLYSANHGPRENAASGPSGPGKAPPARRAINTRAKQKTRSNPAKMALEG